MDTPEQPSDHYAAENGIETQQSTQEASQDLPQDDVAQLWGYLQPCSSALIKISFWKTNPIYHIGRNPVLNHIVFPGLKISELSL
jgi:ser/thr/tyr protein kinase RAD53